MYFVWSVKKVDLEFKKVGNCVDLMFFRTTEFGRIDGY